MNYELKDPRGIRNNNPLNIRYNVNNKWCGRVVTEKKDKEFEEFVQLMWGYRAAFIIIKNYMESGLTTVAQIIRKWAPPKENNTQRYIRTVCEKANLREDEELDFLMPCKMVPLVKAMAFVEVGCVPAHEDCHKAYRAVVEQLHYRIRPKCLDNCCPVPGY